MRKAILSVILYLYYFLCLPTELAGQDHYVSLAKAFWPKEEFDQAALAAKSNKMNKEEQEVIILLNLVRSNPPLFYEKLAKPYLDSIKPKEFYWNSLIKDLTNTTSMPMLATNDNLFSMAENHAVCTGKIGHVGHDCPKGFNFNQRLKKYNLNNSYVGENCSYGYNSAMDIVMQLLVDEDVPSLGHRVNILNKVYKKVGVATRPHAKWESTCVIDFGK
jgi:hypothetical protein